MSENWELLHESLLRHEITDFAIICPNGCKLPIDSWDFSFTEPYCGCFDALKSQHAISIGNDYILFSTYCITCQEWMWQ